MYYIALRITLKSPSAVYFCAVTNIYPHAVHAWFGSCSEEGLPHLQIAREYSVQVFLFCLIDNKQQNYFSFSYFSVSDAAKP